MGRAVQPSLWSNYGTFSSPFCAYYWYWFLLLLFFNYSIYLWIWYKLCWYHNEMSLLSRRFWEACIEVQTCNLTTEEAERGLFQIWHWLRLYRFCLSHHTRRQTSQKDFLREADYKQLFGKYYSEKNTSTVQDTGTGIQLTGVIKWDLCWEMENKMDIVWHLRDWKHWMGDSKNRITGTIFLWCLLQSEVIPKQIHRAKMGLVFFCMSNLKLLFYMNSHMTFVYNIKIWNIINGWTNEWESMQQMDTQATWKMKILVPTTV